MKRTCSYLHAEDYTLDCTSQLAYLDSHRAAKDRYIQPQSTRGRSSPFFSSIPPSSDSLSQTQSPHSEFRDSAGGSRLDTGGFWRSPSRAAAECALSNQTINQSINQPDHSKALADSFSSACSNWTDFVKYTAKGWFERLINQACCKCGIRALNALNDNTVSYWRKHFCLWRGKRRGTRKSVYVTLLQLGHSEQIVTFQIGYWIVEAVAGVVISGNETEGIRRSSENWAGSRSGTTRLDI